MSEWNHLPPDGDEDDLDKVIQQSIRWRTSKAKPSEEVWHRIKQQVEAGPAFGRRHPRARRFRLMWAPLVQGLAAVALLLLGFSFTSRLWMKDYGFNLRATVTRPAVDPTAAVAVEQTIAVVSQPTPALKLPDDDMMNQGAVLRSLHQQELLMQVIAETSDPRRDPSLARRHEPRAPTNQVAVSAFVWDLVSPNSRALFGSK